MEVARGVLPQGQVGPDTCISIRKQQAFCQIVLALGVDGQKNISQILQAKM